MDRNAGFLWRDAEFGEGRKSRKLADAGAAKLEAGSAVEHRTRAPNGGESFAEGGLCPAAVEAVAAVGSPVEDHVVAGLYGADAGAERLDYAGAFVSENHGERPTQIALDHMPIAVADAGSSQAHPYFTGFGVEQFDVFCDEGAS